ncbi:MAG: DUF7113 family protein [Halanaeroarchaeum sp.]
MLLVQGSVGGTTLTGTLYERGEDAPAFEGAPDEDAPYVFVCDSFYEVGSGGIPQRIGDREIQVAFESPAPKGFDTKRRALTAAREHVRTQFARIGVDPGAVETSVVAEHEG